MGMKRLLEAFKLPEDTPRPWNPIHFPHPLNLFICTVVIIIGIIAVSQTYCDRKSAVDSESPTRIEKAQDQGEGN